MNFQGQKIVFLNDPFSPLAVMIGLTAAVSLVAFGYWYVRMAGMKRGGTLLAIRCIELAMVVLLLLQPASVEYKDVLIDLPESFHTKNLRVFAQDELPSLLPPLSAYDPPPSILQEEVELEGVTAPPFLYLKSESNITVRLNVTGNPQEGTLVVRRLESAGTVEIARVKASLVTGRQEVRIPLTLSELGRVACSVSIEGPLNDTDPDNNHLVFQLVVGRDSTRILHVAGHPSWDVRFMREQLVAMPGIELVSFYLLVEAEDFAPHSREELSLIPFPTRELFIEELGNFDLVILHNFPLGSYFQLKEEHHSRLIDYVKSGGSLLFLGGDQAFGADRWQDAAIRELVPAEIHPSAPVLLEGPWQVELPPEHHGHPIIAGLTTEDTEGDQPGPPSIQAINPLGKTEPWATALAEASLLQKRYPLVIAGDYHKGRIVALATDSLWNWAFAPSQAGRARESYGRLISNSVSWLTRDPRVREIDVRPDENPGVQDSPQTVNICLLSHQEDATAHIQAQWRDLFGKTASFKFSQEIPFASQRCVSFTLPATKAGAWVLDISSDSTNRKIEVREIHVIEPARETAFQRTMSRIKPILERNFYPFVVDSVFPWSLEEKTMTVQKPVATSIWDNPIMFSLFIAVLFAEWILRKRWGYL